MNKRTSFLFLIVACLLLAGCRAAPVPAGETPTVLPESATVTATSTAIPSATASLAPTTTPTLPIPTSTPTYTPRPTHLAHQPLIALTMMTQDGKRAVHVIRPDGTGLTRLDPGPTSSYSPQWSQDGQRIAYLSGDSDDTTLLSILDYESGKIQKVDVPGVSTFTWSPDGQRLAFAAKLGKDEGGAFPIYLVTISDFKLELLYEMPYNKRPARLDWSPKGDKILALVDIRGFIFHIRLFSLSGEYEGIDPGAHLVYSASWDPTGEWIAFGGKELLEYTGQIWVVPIEGKQKQLIVQSEDVHDVDWSPDGKKLAYDSGCCDSPSRVSVIDLETKAVLRITQPEGYTYVAGWSPDGAYLAILQASEDVFTKGYSLQLYSFGTGAIMEIIKNMVDGCCSWRQ